ncbi:MAG: AmmeMemoRadiSam system protein B [Balneolaceae bacterium]|nr:AmmeMemoRadiSam system protein B [Balneolaceae bacterium]
MNVQNLTEEEIRDYIKGAKKTNPKSDPVRMVFVPNKINEDNFGELCSTYKAVGEHEFDSIIVIESYAGHLNKKLAMPSNKTFETRFGEVTVNDFLRNEFCDEEDDFFIYDEGFSKEMSLFTQLPVLQAWFKEFEVLSLQIGDYDPAIVRELAFTLDELMMNRNSLLVFCCDVPADKPGELEKLRELVVNRNDSGLLNYLNSSDKQVKGARAFMTGVLVSRSWNLDICLLDQLKKASNICGYGKLTQPMMA